MWHSEVTDSGTSQFCVSIQGMPDLNNPLRRLH